VWPVRYLALELGAVLGEIMRHFISDIPPQLEAEIKAGRGVSPHQVVEQLRILLAGLNNRRISELAVDLSRVLDCRDIIALGLAPPLIKPGDLYHDTDYETGHALAAAVIARGCTAMLVPSATGFGDSLIVFPDHLASTDSVTLVRSIDSPLFVDR
jgi:hypothetical protein